MDEEELQYHMQYYYLFDDAQDIKTPYYVLNELSNHKSHHIRMCIMGNISSPIDTLEKLCWDEDPEVRCWIHFNKKESIKKLQQAEDDLYFLL